MLTVLGHAGRCGGEPQETFQSWNGATLPRAGLLFHHSRGRIADVLLVLVGCSSVCQLVINRAVKP